LNTESNDSELDQLLKKVVERQEALKMPKKKLHWKQKAKLRRERNKRENSRPSAKARQARYDNTLKRRWGMLRKQIKKQKPEWDLALEDWLWAWAIARPATVRGHKVPAMNATGRRKEDVRFMRIDKSLPYRADNIQIVQGKEVLYP
jgi:hypothetical protein